MKLHLPLSLRRCLLSVMTIVVGITSPVAQAGVMHEDVTFQTYADFGQNKGRYVTDGRVNALLQYIRDDVDQGIVITYTDGTPSFTISNEQGMIDFSGTDDIGAQVAISPTFAATVLHNGSINASYGNREVGSEHAINYNAIDIRSSNVFRLAPENGNGGLYDYMLQRQSKIVTDTDYNPVTSITDMNSLDGKYLYHSGAGAMGIWTEPEGKKGLTGAYVFIIGGIVTIQDAQQHVFGTATNISIHQNPGYGNGVGASIRFPLPNAIQGGDSGSPVFVYNEDTKQYEYLAAQQSGGGNAYGQARGDVIWTHEILAEFNQELRTGQDGTIKLGSITAEGDFHIDSSQRSVQEYYGTATNSRGEVIGTYSGIRSGLSTWSDLSDEKDKQNWYAYSGHLNRSVPELFFNDNLVFVAEAAENTVELQGTVDLGVGYVQFDRGELEKTTYNIVAPEDSGYLLNSAGYVINEGVDVHISFTNPSDHMYEWRKSGAGDLYIEGSGDTNALLTLGGPGSTYLNREDGYAAYNVLASSGARVVISDTAQIVRDFTFGSGGGTLDMNGNSMDWYLSNADVQADGFSINALTEEAIISNTSGNATLTYKESGNATFLGSFQDSETASLSIDYQGSGVLTLNSIHTDLSHNAASGLTVSNGKIVLVGTNTVHGMGSLNGWSNQRLVKSDDWHYADAAMDVTVKDGATFELGSHARLTGDVTVDEGATFIMREGVKNRMEYVEGGAFLEDTNRYAAFYGLKGDVALSGNMRVEFHEDVTSCLTYNGNISGSGSLEISLGTRGGILELGGDNSGFTGTKKIESGGVVLQSAAAMGDTSDNKWIVSSDGWIANHALSSAQLLAQVNEGSTGTMALSNDTAEQLDMSRHERLTLGAASGRTVQYGEAGTQETLNAVLGAWRLGGAGGELVVNYKLSGANDLILGASGHSSGVVTLTNTQNDFSGDIIFSGDGIVLNTVEGALGNSVLNLVYGNGFGLTSADSITKNVGLMSDGMVTVDAVSNQRLDMSGHRSLAIAAEKAVEFSGSIALSAGQGYLFSSVTGGKLTLLSELDSSRSLEVDAQGLTGGAVVLAGNDSWSGDITVRGHRDNNGEGEISLQLGQDVAAGGKLTLAQGGILDLAGHNLSVSGTIVTDGGQLTNSGSTGALIFDCSAQGLTSTADLSVGTIRKTGSNMLSLGGNNAPCQFYVEEGTLRLVSDGAFTSGSTVHLGDGSILDNRTHALLAGVSLENGKATLTSSNHSHIVVRGSVSIGDKSHLTIGKDGLASISIDGDLSVGSGSSLAILSNSKASFTIGGNINLTEGTNLNFGNFANISLSGENIGTGSSSIVLNGGQLNLNKGGNISINSDLTINGNTTIYSRGSADAMGRNFERVIVNGCNLTLREESWSTVWNINSLKGSGELCWESTTTHSTSSRLILNGDGDFDGRISMNRTWQNKDRTHGAYLELVSDFVAANADISLTGAASNAVASLAVNTDNAHIKGLSGNGHSFVYAGASRVDTALSGSDRPETTRAATLTIDTAADSNYTFSGSIGNTTDTSENGITLVKTGSGTQTLNGASVVLSNVSALAGTLNITSSSLTVSGNVSLARGAELKLGDSYSLNEGQKLYLMAGAENSGAAVFNSALVFNGGSISIDARGLSVDSPLLALGGAVTVGSSFGASCQLSFSNTSGISMGTDYLLATGDWNLLNNRISMVNSDISNATFTASSTGLSVMFTLKDGYLLWEGEERILQSGNKVVFNGSNGYNTFNLSQDAALGTGYFNNAETVSISGAALSIGTLHKKDTGALQIDADVSVDNMVVKDATTIGGEGSLRVGSLILESDLTTRMAVQVVGDIQAQGAKWTVDGSNNAFTQCLSLDQVNATGGVNVEGAATLEVRVEGGNQTISGAVSGSGQIALVGGGSLEKNQQEHINLSRVALSNLVLKNGSTDITGEVNLTGRLSIGHEDVRLTEGAQVTAAHFRMGDTENYQPSTVTIEEGASLEITGNADADNTSASFMLSHWKNSFSTLVLNGGTITSENASMHMGWDSGARFEALAGKATLKGICFSTARGNADTLVLGEAILNIGSGGITGIGSNDTVQFGNGTIAATANFTISGNNAINLVGATNGTVFDTAGHTITVNTDLAGNGNLNKAGDGTLNLNGSTAQYTGNVNINGGTLMLGSNALEVLTSGSELVVNKGGKLDLSAAGRSANLSRVSGAGTVVLNYGIGDKDNGSGFDFSGLTGEVELRSGRIQLDASTFGEDCPDFRLTSSNSQLVFNGNGTVVNSNVHVSADTTDFHVNSGKSGTIGGDITGNSLVKQGGGTLTVGGNMKLDVTLSTRAGEVILTGEDNSITNVDGAMTGATTAEGKLRLAQDARLQVTGNIWGRSNTGIHLDSGAELNISGQSLSISNRAEEGTASLAATTSTGPGEYNINRTNYQISNAHVTYTGGDATINNRLTNSAIENAGNGILKVNNAENSLSAVHATGGSIKLFSADELDLKALEVAASLSVSAYCDVRERENEEARINVSEIATFGAGVTLNADIVMKSGATLKIADTVQMGSDVRLETGLTLTGTLYNDVKSMKAGERVTLFTGVDALYLGSSQESITSITLSNGMQANDYFTNLSDSYFLIYDASLGDGQGELSIGMVVPEPTTATLSLVALAALAMRRRRK